MRYCIVQVVLFAVATAFTSQSSSIIGASSTASRRAADFARASGSPRLNRQSSIVNRQFLPSHRTLLDAHNAYPDRGRFADRIDVALATGLPVAIEQDLAWCVSAGGTLAPLVSHESTCVGGEPTLEAYFFERVRPIVEAALAKGPSADWPLITLNLDFKTNEPEHHAAVWALLGKYERWLTTAPAARRCRGRGAAAGRAGAGADRLARPPAGDVSRRRPGGRPAAGVRRHCRHRRARIEPLGAATRDTGHQLPPLVESSVARRSRWKASAPRATWTPADAARLAALVSDAHAHGLWIRFYTLNGVAGEREGWTASYNFGSLDAAAAPLARRHRREGRLHRHRSVRGICTITPVIAICVIRNLSICNLQSCNSAM